MKTKIGHMACPDCTKPVVVKKNERDTLSYSCPECDGNAYCKKGEGRYTTWMGRTTLLAAPKPAPGKPAGDPAPPPAPEKKPVEKMPWMP